MPDLGRDHDRLDSGSAFAQNKAIDFTKGMPFSEGFVAGKTPTSLVSKGRTLGQGHRDRHYPVNYKHHRRRKGRRACRFKMSDLVAVTVYVTDLNDVKKMNDVYIKLMPDPKPARATVQVAGLIGGAKIEISAIAVKH